MSRSPYLSQTSRRGARMGDATVVDAMTGVRHDPIFGIHMGVTAENIAERWGISRAEQDELALESHRASPAGIRGRGHNVHRIQQTSPCRIEHSKLGSADGLQVHFRGLLSDRLAHRSACTATIHFPWRKPWLMKMQVLLTPFPAPVPRDFLLSGIPC